MESNYKMFIRIGSTEVFIGRDFVARQQRNRFFSGRATIIREEKVTTFELVMLSLVMEVSRYRRKQNEQRIDGFIDSCSDGCGEGTE